MTRKERKAWEKKFKPFHETREKERRLNKLLPIKKNEILKTINKSCVTV